MKLINCASPITAPLCGSAVLLQSQGDPAAGLAIGCASDYTSINVYRTSPGGSPSMIPYN